MANEVQHLLPSVSPTLFEDGAIELTFDGQTTASISYGDINSTSTFASKIQTELEALSNIGSGNVSVAWVTDRAVVTFQGTLANTDVPEITVSANTLKAKADTVTVNVTQPGSLASLGGSFTDGNDVDTPATQTVTFSPTPSQGTWTFDGNTVTYPSAPSRSGWSVSGDYSGGFTLTYGDNSSGQSEASKSNTDLGVPCVFTVTLSDGPTEGGFTITRVGQWTAPSGSEFAYNASAGTVESGIEAVAATGFSVSGTGAVGDPYVIAADVAGDLGTITGEEGSTPLRKGVTLTPSTETEGNAGFTPNASLLVHGQHFPDRSRPVPVGY